MKKIALIIALVMFALVTGGLFAQEENVVLVKLDTSFKKDGKPLDATDIAVGRGWIVGDQFTKVMSAKPGSFIRLSVYGTKNLNWDSVGAVGVKKVENQTKRIEFRPKKSDDGNYTIDIPIDALLKKIKGEKEAIGINVWGDHEIKKVELYLY